MLLLNNRVTYMCYKGGFRIFLQGGPTFVLKITKIQYLSTFKQMLAVCICLTNLPVLTRSPLIEILFFFKVFIVLIVLFFTGREPLKHFYCFIVVSVLVECICVRPTRSPLLDKVIKWIC